MRLGRFSLLASCSDLHETAAELDTAAHARTRTRAISSIAGEGCPVPSASTDYFRLIVRRVASRCGSLHPWVAGQKVSLIFSPLRHASAFLSFLPLAGCSLHPVHGTHLFSTAPSFCTSSSFPCWAAPVCFALPRRGIQSTPSFFPNLLGTNTRNLSPFPPPCQTSTRKYQHGPPSQPHA